MSISSDRFAGDRGKPPAPSVDPAAPRKIRVPTDAEHARDIVAGAMVIGSIVGGLLIFAGFEWLTFERAESGAADLDGVLRAGIKIGAGFAILLYARTFKARG